MPFLERQSQLGQIPWGDSWLWDLRFDDAPAPFNNWFPASDVDENKLTLNTKTIEGGISTYEIPEKTAAFDITITFFDDENHTLLEWLSDWVNSIIFNGERRVAVLEQAVKRVDLIKMNSRRETIKEDSYLIFPKGSNNFRGTIDSAVPQYPVAFVIAGT